MSRKINLTEFTDQQLQKISQELNIEKEKSKYARNSVPDYICLFEAEREYAYIPFAYNKNFNRPERKDFSVMNVEFKEQLREEQKKVKDEAISRLNSHGSVMISARCGFGKTFLAIYIATKIKLKTLILCHRIVLINQWKESIEKVCPEAKIQILSSKCEMQDCDFYIVNATNVRKHDRLFYKDIGFVIVDEAHIVMAEKMSQCMQYLLPRYVLGLSATPYRVDGLDSLLEMYFGTYKIERKLFRKHLIYKINTGIVPDVKTNKMGKVDWSSVLESTCLNDNRNEMIIKLVKYFPERIFLVLCKRVEQAKYLEKRLKEEKEDVTSLIGSNQEYDKKSRILIGTVGKCSVGFDHAKLDTMILASDVQQYFEQYIGRIMRTQDGEPVIFDIVDKYPLLEKHFRSRSAVYTEMGGIVKDFKKCFPDFEI